MTPASKLRAKDARRQFVEAINAPDGAIDLARAALLIAAEDEATPVAVAHYLSTLDALGERARKRLAAAASAPVEAFNRFMFEETGFAGNKENYYDPRNSFLNQVIDRRSGIPITLSVVYIEVGRRAGLITEGVGLPGHFIVRARHKSSGEASLIDRFHGVILSAEGCQRLLDEVFAGQVALTNEHLRAAPAREILIRVLTNLKAIYTRANLYRRALAAVERIQLLAPEAAAERRDRSALLAQLERFPEAIKEATAYLRLSPGAADAEQVRGQLHTMQRQHAMRN